MNQALDAPAAASPAAALLDLDPNSAGTCSFGSQALNSMLGAAEAEDSADIAGIMRRLPLPAPVFQGGGINGARRPPAGGAKLLGGAIPLKGVEAAEEPFEGLARDCPFQTFKKRRSKKKEAASIEFEAAALEGKLLLQGEAAASICTEFIQSEDSLQLPLNRPLEGGDESDGRQKRECYADSHIMSI
ncbi:MAG: hypothetical protein LBU32_07105 [Clostridiales bacterium]|jgi:hypothetical protein|nr:hypothetical protein [Clostridiales bacterium]